MKLAPIDCDGAVDVGAAEPHAALADVVQATTDLYRRRGFAPPWIGYVAVEFGRVVGTCGFAAPAANGEAEIAYFTFPGHEGRGVATRMAAALTALSEDAAYAAGACFVANTLPTESASTSILKRLGFVLLGNVRHPEDGDVWKWRRPAAEPDRPGTVRH